MPESGIRVTEIFGNFASSVASLCPARLGSDSATISCNGRYAVHGKVSTFGSERASSAIRAHLKFSLSASGLKKTFDRLRVAEGENALVLVYVLLRRLADSGPHVVQLR